MTVSFWLILLAALVYGLLHSFLASFKVKKWARQSTGPAYDRWYRLAFNLIVTVTLLPLMLLPVWLPDKGIYVIPFPWVIITLVIQGLAALLLLTALHQSGIASFLGLTQIIKHGEASTSEFEIGGLYHFVRHPQYTAGLVILWLTPILTWNILGLILGLTIYIVIGAQVEERKLVQEFGLAYSEYRRKTPMLIPGLQPRSRQDTSGN